MRPRTVSGIGCIAQTKKRPDDFLRSSMRAHRLSKEAMKPFDRILTVDLETRWSSRDYTLQKLTTEEYIRDKRFACFGVCTHLYGSDEPIRWVRGSDLPEYFSGIDWGRTAVLAHNAQFDVSILEWRYNAHPAFIFDTLSMARALRGVEAGNSLAKLAEDFGLPAKGKAVHSTDGLQELTPDIERELAEYCKHDVYLCEEIFKRLGAGYPTKELRLIDMTLKMYTRPVLELDQKMLIQALVEEGQHRERLLERVGAEEAELASNPKFAALLRTLGVMPPMKKSKTTGKMTLALAKTDAMFQALLNGDNEDVAALCEARLKVKSTTERTRAQRFLDISQRGKLPVPLSYYGAKSGRWAAAKSQALNMQNLKRGSFLRKAIMAPDGCQLVVGDLSQIEPRVLAWLANYDEMLDIFRAKGDPYAQFGAQMFGIPGMTKESHSVERQSAKSAMLGCLSGDTPVLTNSGYKPMLEIQLTDLLWDGVAWVPHQGLVHKGEKETWTYNGLTATADHKILVGFTWHEWQEVLTTPSLFWQALSSATSPVLSGDNANLPAGTGKLKLLKQRMQTYDIAYAGPRNRYTVLTDAGPIIVHNCGYGLGWASFSAQLLVGFLGAPPLRYSKEDAKKLGVTMEGIQAFIKNDDYVARMREIPHTCTEQELLIHCVAAKAIIDKYRAAAWPVKSFWALMEELLVRCLAGGEEIVYKCLIFRKEEIVLPSGMSILYPNLRQEKDDKGVKRWVYGPDATPLYGGKITNNCVQGTARVVMTDGMLRVSKRYFVAGTVHDEQIVVVPDSEAEEALEWVLQQMTLEPSYMPGIPLAADGGVHRRYGLAKN